MNNPIFTFTGARPPLVCSLSDKTELDTICTMRNAIFDGADGFLIHLERMDPALWTRDAMRRIFAYAEDKPILTLHYRGNTLTDEDRAKIQLDAVAAGAGCVDVMGDMFGACEGELTFDPAAMEQQARYIDEIHSRGAQVMMTSHLYKFEQKEQILTRVLEMERRGADIVKIAMAVANEEELLASIEETTLMRKTLHVPFLHIAIGQWGKVHRVMAPTLGSCMVLCVQRYTPAGHKDKPLLRATRAIYDNLDWHRFRD